MRDPLRDTLSELMMIPGLSGHEDRVRRAISARLGDLGIQSRTDRLGNLIATIEGDPEAPSIMLFAHMDQLGFVVRKIEADGLVRVERLGGAHFRVTCYPPLEKPDSGDRQADIVALMGMVNATLGDWVRERPEQWLWIHNRWPAE